MPLSDTALRSLKPRQAAYKVADGGGLYIYVTPAGARLWRMAYRFEGKQRTLSIGSYPVVTLAAARDARTEAKRLLLEGRDPSEAKQRKDRAEAVEALAEDTFLKIATRFFELREDTWSDHYHKVMWRRLERDVFPEIGAMRMCEIEPPKMLATLRQIEARGVSATAHKVRFLCGQIFRFAIAEGMAVRDPTADLRGALAPKPKVKNLPKVGLKDVPKLFADIHCYSGDTLTRQALLLALHTFVRTDELRFARVEELSLDGDEPVWRIPEDRMKRGREHIVPLSRQAVSLFRSIRIQRPKTGLVFSAFTTSGVMSENTMLYGLYRLGYHSRQTVHGFRGLASTVLNESGKFDRDWIEVQLAHTDEDQVRSAYNAAQYLAQRREMMQWWSDWIDEQAVAGGYDPRVSALI